MKKLLVFCILLLFVASVSCVIINKQDYGEEECAKTGRHAKMEIDLSKTNGSVTILGKDGKKWNVSEDSSGELKMEPVK